MDQDLDTRLKALEEKVEKTAKAVEQMRKMYLWTMWLGIAMIVLPLIGLAFVLPGYLKSFDINGLVN